MKGLANLLTAMTEEAKRDMQRDELPLFLELVNIVSKMLQPDNLPKWRGLEFSEKENGGSATMIGRFESWALESTSNVQLASPADVVSSSKKTSNTELEVVKSKVFTQRQSPLLSYPTNTDRTLNRVQFASELFHKPEFPECAFADVSILYAKYDTYGSISPLRVSTIGFSTSDTNLLRLDGPVVSTRLKIVPPASSGEGAQSAERCAPSELKLRKYPVVAYLAHHTKLPAIRRPLFHEDEVDSEILRRTCVWWNTDLSDYVGWDATGCSAIESTPFFTKCACHRFGQYAVMMEKVAPKLVDLEYEWLKIVKYVCYAVSALLLVIFIVTVLGFKQLREMFHLLRVHTAAALLCGSLAMCLSDLEAVRQQRHLCVAVGALQHLFYLQAAALIAVEALADFRSVTAGVIGGKLRAYVALAWGLSLFSLGYAIYFYLPDYGTDPRCMVSWSDEVKWTMLGPLCVCLLVGVGLSGVVLCNMQSSWLRKENIAAEQLSVCRGLVFFSPYFSINWLVGVIAYLRLGLNVPSFYPLFQVMNSIVGILFFLFCGLGSDRFRLLMAGKATWRNKMMLSLTVEEQLGKSQEVLVQGSEEDVEEEPQEQMPYDPNQPRARRTLVA